MTTEQSHETSAEHSCGCGESHGGSHESPKPQEVVVESPQPQTQSGKLITITAKAAEKINEFMAEEKEKPEVFDLVWHNQMIGRGIELILFLHHLQ